GGADDRPPWSAEKAPPPPQDAKARGERHRLRRASAHNLVGFRVGSGRRQPTRVEQPSPEERFGLTVYQTVLLPRTSRHKAVTTPLPLPVHPVRDGAPSD